MSSTTSPAKSLALGPAATTTGVPGAPGPGVLPEEVHEELLVAIEEVQRRIHQARAEAVRLGAWMAADFGRHLPELMADRRAVQQHRLFARLPLQRGPQESREDACPACGGPRPCAAVDRLAEKYGITQAR